jgi:myo-inositol-1(or 4)-monophosphatase
MVAAVRTDIAVEDRIRNMLSGSPGASVVGEERGGSESLRSYWIVDPICGTRNYASAVPLWCVNLALVEDGQVTIAVVGDGSTGELLVAESGQGGWVVMSDQIRRLQVSADSQTVIVEDGKSSGARRERAAGFLADVVLVDRWDLRTLSTTLSAAYVATGRVAAYVLFACSKIHIAAGSLLVSEAGATVSELDGNPWEIESDSFVAAATRQLHEELLALIPAASDTG